MADVQCVRLASGGNFSDLEGDFFLNGDEVQPLPIPLGELTRLWLNAGGIVFCDEDGNVAPPDTPDDTIALASLDADERTRELSQLTLLQLRERCTALGIKFHWKSKEQQLIALILKAEAK